MAKAMKSTMKETRHRWCRWHVLKNAKDRLGKVYSKHKGFKHEFNKLVTDETDITKFEMPWDTLVKKYRLSKNKFLKRLFKYREKWAKPYFMGIFCAGMTSTQRSESANHMLKRFIQRAAPMHLFVAKFNEFQSDRNDQESKESFVTNQVPRKLRVSVPIENHAHTIYTRATYEKFYDELFESGRFAITSKISEYEYIVTDTKQDTEEATTQFTVTLQGTSKVTCQCGLFEHMGMLCRHALKVLVHLDRQEIPAGNIMRRWTKEGLEHSLSVDSKATMAAHNDNMRKKLLLTIVFEIANKEATLSETTFHQAMEAMKDSTDPPLEPALADITNTSTAAIAEVRPTACPPRTMLGGRPPNTGLQSWLASRKRSSNKTANSASALVADWPDEENTPTKKRRSISDIMYK
ncbi:protein FAR-RED IMPAIRED RESPONSE 1-like [Panicum virgatum]|nr:protein FAR-RED IMPAIRED RESPONSE 1-like [Panicum virgatum]